MKKISIILMSLVLLISLSSATLAAGLKFGYNTGDCSDSGTEVDLSSFTLGFTNTTDSFQTDVNVIFKDLDVYTTNDYEFKVGYKVLGSDAWGLYPTLGYLKMSAIYEGVKETTAAFLYGLGVTYNVTDQFSASAFVGKGFSGEMDSQWDGESDADDIMTYNLELDYQFSDVFGLFVNYRSDEYEEPNNIEWSSYGLGVTVKF